MKKLLFFLLTLFYSSWSYGQLMVNSDFTINSGNNGYSCDNYSVTSTFDVGSVPNWTISHGSPSFCEHPGTPDCPYPNDITMDVYDGIGEGIVGGYEFLTGDTYYIHVGLRDFGSSNVRIIIGNGPRPSISDCEHLCTDPTSLNGVCPFPSPISPGDPTMYELPVGTLNGGDNLLTVNPPINCDWIMIFPYIKTSCESSDGITLMYVRVYKQCRGDLYIPQYLPPSFPTNPMNPFDFTDINIYAGSMYGGSTPLAVNPGGNTLFEASQQVEIDNVFEAAPKNGYFLAEITPNACFVPCDVAPIEGGPVSTCVGFSSYLSDPTPGGVWSSSNPGIASVSSSGYVTGTSVGSTTINYTIGSCIASTSVTVAQYSVCEKPAANPKMTGNIELYPNPVQDELNITYSCDASGPLNISISDVSGRKMYTENIDCEKGAEIHHAVDMSAFTKGIYFVQLTLNDQHVVRKIVKL